MKRLIVGLLFGLTCITVATIIYIKPHEEIVGKNEAVLKCIKLGDNNAVLYDYVASHRTTDGKEIVEPGIETIEEGIKNKNDEINGLTTSATRKMELGTEIYAIKDAASSKDAKAMSVARCMDYYSK